jgi:hypothetical protein
LANKIGQYMSFFALYEITPSAHSMEVLMTIEHSQQSHRQHGLGYLFGFRFVTWTSSSGLVNRSSGPANPTASGQNTAV